MYSLLHLYLVQYKILVVFICLLFFIHLYLFLFCTTQSVTKPFSDFLHIFFITLIAFILIHTLKLIFFFIIQSVIGIIFIFGLFFIIFLKYRKNILKSLSKFVSIQQLVLIGFTLLIIRLLLFYITSDVVTTIPTTTTESDFLFTIPMSIESTTMILNYTGQTNTLKQMSFLKGGDRSIGNFGSLFGPRISSLSSGFRPTIINNPISPAVPSFFNHSRAFSIEIWKDKTYKGLQDFAIFNHFQARDSNTDTVYDNKRVFKK